MKATITKTRVFFPDSKPIEGWKIGYDNRPGSYDVYRTLRESVLAAARAGYVPMVSR